MSIRAWFSDVLTSSPQGISWKDKIVVGAPLRLTVRRRPLAGPSETGLFFIPNNTNCYQAALLLSMRNCCRIVRACGSHRSQGHCQTPSVRKSASEAGACRVGAFRRTSQIGRDSRRADGPGLICARMVQPRRGIERSRRKHDQRCALPRLVRKLS